jgi:hypothetical protein
MKRSKTFSFKVQQARGQLHSILADIEAQADKEGSG